MLAGTDGPWEDSGPGFVGGGLEALALHRRNRRWAHAGMFGRGQEPEADEDGAIQHAKRCQKALG